MGSHPDSLEPVGGNNCIKIDITKGWNLGHWGSQIEDCTVSIWHYLVGILYTLLLKLYIWEMAVKVIKHILLGTKI